MGDMRADCMGATNVVGAMLAISELKLPLNVIGEFNVQAYKLKTF